jgi:hypothetical protein
MNQTEQRPLAGRSRRRGWIDILLFRPLSTNPQVALVLTRRGRLFSVIPAGSARVISDYIDWPCEIIEVDGRERQLVLDLPLESRDSGRCFQAAIQLVYSVVRPERVALEIDDALGELERTLIAAMQITARSLTIDHPATLKESILELLQRGGSLAIRIASLGLALRRADIAIDIQPSDRAFVERLNELQREHIFACRILAESQDPKIDFEVHVTGAYRYRSRAMLNSQPDEAEFALRTMIANSIRRVAIEYAPHESREAANAMIEALRTNSILIAELAAAELEFSQPVIDIRPARPMLAAAMPSRFLPAPAAADDLFERILPPLAPPLQLPAPPPIPAAAPIMMHAIDPEELLHTAPAIITPPVPETTGRQFDPQLFKTMSTELEPLLPGWLPGWTTDQHQFVAAIIEEDMTEEDMTKEDSIGKVEQAALVPSNPAAAPLQLASATEDRTDQISRWIQLLRSDGDEEFERLAIVLIERPDRLPTLLNGLIRDPAILKRSADPAYQQALSNELEQYITLPTPPAWLAEAPTEINDGSSHADQQTLPDWLRIG